MNALRKPIAALILLASLSSVPAAEQATPPITLKQLEDMVKQLSLKPKPVSKGGVVNGCEFEINLDSDGSAPFRFVAQLTEDGKTVWLKMRLSKLTDLDGVPAAIFLKLLHANHRVSPAYFVYVDDESALYFYLPLNGAGLTSDVLKAQIGFLIDRAHDRDNYPLWNPKRWPKSATPLPTGK